MIPALIVLLGMIAMLLFAVSAGTLWWMLHAWRTPEDYQRAEFPEVQDPRYSFSIIMPCRDELEPVMEETLTRLLNQTHPRVEVVLSVGHDDHVTLESAERLAETYGRRVKVSINNDAVKNKPRQLNTALMMCSNEIVGVMDAESLTHPGLLAGIDTTFAVRGADVVQGAVHLINYRSRWFSLRNCLEYRIWFRSRLHGHADSGFIPLGGNTVFIWRDLLLEVGGWDGDCLAEDCELGVRLSALGKKVSCVYDRELTTLEESPATVRTFIRQRTRWSLGFMQVLAKGEWRKLPTLPRKISAIWMLSQQYAIALAGVLLPIAFITAIVLRLPTIVVMITYLPLIPLVLTLGFELLVLHDFGRDMGYRITPQDYLVLVITTPFYQALLLYSAVVAVLRFRRGNFVWDKTPHEGSHLSLVTDLSREVAA